MRKILLIFGVCCLIIGCSRTYFQEYRTLTQDQYKVGIILHQLSASSIQVLATHDDVTIIIPGRMLFQNDSPNFIDQAYQRLNLIVDFLKYFETVDIQVIGFANQRNLAGNSTLAALTLARAQKVSSYLLLHEVDVRLLSADGYELQTMHHGKIVLSDCIVIYFPRS